jgi:GxxExxY protein
MSQLIKKDLIYPELSYRIIGILFEVYNSVGSGYHEKYYQGSIAVSLQKARFLFREQAYAPLNFKDEKIRSYFLIDNKIIL